MGAVFHSIAGAYQCLALLSTLCKVLGKVSILLPSHTPIYGGWVWLISFPAASLVVVRKHRRQYLQGLVPRTVFLRNASVELFGILLAMALAGLVGRYAAQIATEQVDHGLARLITGVTVALLAGTGAGLLVKRTWGRLTKV
jgi:hypothetical protein